MPANINSVTVSFSHGIKREEYGPTKKAEASITAGVDETEDGAVILAYISNLAMARVADMLSAPKPEQYGKPAFQQAAEQLDAAEGAEANPPPARRTRGPNKAKDSAPAEAPATVEEPATGTAVEDEWSVGAEDIVITDQEMLSALSRRASELGGREQCIKLVSSFATRTEGAPFKVQEIPQAQRKDFLDKLAHLTA